MTENQNKTVSEEPGQRLVSVDALRGFDMLWITGAGSLLVGICGRAPTIN